MLNQVILIGRLGQDAEVKKVGDNQIATFSIATERYKSATKETVTDWVDVTLWNPGGVAQYLVKGQLVYCQGRIYKRSWKGNDQKTHYKQEVACNLVKLLARPNTAEGQQQTQAAPKNAQGYRPTDDDVPF